MTKKEKIFCDEITKYLNEHWEEPLLAKEVAPIHGYTESYFNKKFKQCFGMSYGQYIKRLKFQKIALLMREGKKIKHFGEKMGYANAQSFSKAFHKEFGMSPRDFLLSDIDVPDQGPEPEKKRRKNWSEEEEDQFRYHMVDYLCKYWAETSVEKAAKWFGYSETKLKNRFKEVFGLSFIQYLKKLRLRKVAGSLIKNGIGYCGMDRTGYTYSQNFFRAFRDEFGMSPKQFIQSYQEIPDMPIFYQINGETVSVEYRNLEERIVHGRIVDDCQYDGTSLSQKINIYFNHSDECMDFDREKRQFAAWWHHDNYALNYIRGEEAEAGAQVPEGMMEMKMPASYYAIISTHQGVYGNSRSKTLKKLAKFVFFEWLPINKKNKNRMGAIYEEYHGDRISIYIPLQKRDQEMVNSFMENTGADAWIRYIDANIMKGVTVTQVAEHFHYSERHFYTTFQLYYGITPGAYIEKRKLYIAASKLHYQKMTKKDIIGKFGFRSISSFEKDFFEEFGIWPEEFDGDEYKVDDLEHYYTLHKDTLKVRFEEMPDVCMMGANVLHQCKKEVNDYDSMEYIIRGLEDKILLTPNGLYHYDQSQLESSRIVVWQTEIETGNILCLVGPEMKDKEKIPNDFSKIVIKGGHYAILETRQDSDLSNLKENYRKLYRCAFGGWLREFRMMVDFSRLTYVRYEQGKLYFYIPLIK